MRILIACEFSGRVREAFRAKGHDVLSCDVRPTEILGPHYQGDVRDVLYEAWDMLIAHPPCTYNTLAGVRWMYHPDDTHLPAEQRRRHPSYPDRMERFEEGVAFFKLFSEAPIPKICVENSQPHGLAMSRLGRYTQCIQPWMFGDPYTKGACLWLQGLPPLQPTHRRYADYPSGLEAECHSMSPGPDREKKRSRTYPAIAAAMAAQWG
jgi:hypothetical protein